AGAGFGNLAIPRVGQEVIVDFLNGDPDQPIIMGRTYHQDNRSPGSLPGTKTQMTIRSKTYKGDGFNELRFEDATGKEELYMHAQKDMTTEVLHDRTTTVNNNHTETVVVGQTVSVGTKKEGGHDQKITVANDQKITVQNNQTLNVNNDRKKDVGNNQDSKVVGDDTEAVEKSQNITVGKDYTLTVTNSLTIKVGECVLKMNKDGTILLNGVKIQLKADDSIKGVASTVHFN
ncbi:type VI secretion system tip protein VgrG, partial [Salmonella enterica]|nr:type VI secretion system tip protein VgrG [Salmonella enterica]